MGTFKRYMLFSVPGWILGAVVAAALWQWVGLHPLLIAAAYALWVIKDFALYPLLRGAYERNVETGVDSLIGMSGVVQRQLDPQGYVRVRNELWRAEVDAGGAPIEPGANVRVQAVEGFTVLVKRAAEEAKDE